MYDMYEGFEIYDESGNLITEYDLELGHMEASTRTEHHEAVIGVEEEWHWETIAEYPNGGKDVKKVIDVPGVEAKDAWDEKIPIYIYIPYTEEELAAIEEEKNKPSIDDRVTTIEQQLASYEAAYMEGVNEA